ncbi:hypothetical protein NGRA_1028 [Nosema granulosis]|uniref:Mevalonate kinase n=1 Tax=Nosema granulosis TaxID=83296 RepID=A0A9P6H071_9MICR|nr:hypothetical protein NGRA_1028 [Nosema granulosis]
MIKKLRLKIPGKVVTNGSYIVLRGETAVSVTIDRFLDVESSFEASEECSIIVNIKNRERVSCSTNGSVLVCDSSNSETYYIFRIIESFYSLTRIKPANNIVINMSFDRDFFINESVKTGIGSSACIILGIVCSLLHYNEGAYLANLDSIHFIESPSLEDYSAIDASPALLKESSETLIPLLYTINKIINPISSGVDVLSCLLGCIRFNSKTIKRISNIGKYLILGTFGKSSSTRSIINQINLQDEKWDKIIELNNKILQSPGKDAYREYLDHLFALNNFTVPEKQYEILKETFEFDIYGCGISGAGGEDAVWCIVDDHRPVSEYWSTRFSSVIVTLIVKNGVVF